MRAKTMPASAMSSRKRAEDALNLRFNAARASRIGVPDKARHFFGQASALEAGVAQSTLIEVFDLAGSIALLWARDVEEMG